MNSISVDRIQKREFIEVQVVKIPKSKLNDYVRQIGRVIQVSRDGLVVKLESRKIVKFPLNHVRELRRFSKCNKTETEEIYEPRIQYDEDDHDDEHEPECDYGEEEIENENDNE